MAVRPSIIRGTAGVAYLDGQQVAKVTEASVSFDATEVVARAGCELHPWFRALDTRDLTGSLTCQDVSPKLLSLALGGTVTTSNGYDMAAREEQDVSSNTIDLDNGPLVANEDDNLWQVAVIKKTSTGEVIYEQATAAPSAGQFFVNNSGATPQITLSGESDGTAIQVTYMYQDATRSFYTLDENDEPSFVSLVIPLCGYELTNTSTHDYPVLWIGRAKILNVALGAGQAGGELATWNFSFAAVPDEDGNLFKLY